VYLQRDLHAAADYLEQYGEELSEWFSFDLERIEARVLELFTKVAEQTHLELAQIEVQAKQATLAGDACETVLHFKKTSRIPPFPKCHKTVFIRPHK